MFRIFQRSKNGPGDLFSRLGTDMHSHLLPGVDDGSPDLATSLELIRGLAGLGYKRLVTTPHVLWEMYPNTREGILLKANELRSAVEQEGIGVEIGVGAEYFLDAHVAGLLQRKEPLLTIGGNKVLCEFSLAFPSHDLKDILFEMNMCGYQPVIAHPERYIYLQHQKEFFDELKHAGCLFQLNILSLTGHYGKAVDELAHYLLRKGYYDPVSYTHLTLPTKA